MSRKRTLSPAFSPGTRECTIVHSAICEARCPNAVSMCRRPFPRFLNVSVSPEPVLSRKSRTERQWLQLGEHLQSSTDRRSALADLISGFGPMTVTVQRSTIVRRIEAKCGEVAGKLYLERTVHTDLSKVTNAPFTYSRVMGALSILAKRNVHASGTSRRTGYSIVSTAVS